MPNYTFPPPIGAGGGGDATPLEVLDEGISLDTNVASIDFVGEGVTATHVGHDITVTIPGATSGGGLLQSQEFTTPGAFTFQVPVGVTGLFVTLLGAGGGGSSRISSLGGGGGGSGELCDMIPFHCTSGGTVSGSVGAKGTGAAAGGGTAAGGAGTSTTFGYLIALGGLGGTTASLGGAGGGPLGATGAGSIGGVESNLFFGGGGGGSGGTVANNAGGRGAPSGGYLVGAAGGAVGSGPTAGGGGGAGTRYGLGGAGGAGTSGGASAASTSYGSGGGGSGGVAGSNGAGGDGCDGYALIVWVA